MLGIKAEKKRKLCCIVWHTQCIHEYVVIFHMIFQGEKWRCGGCQRALHGRAGPWYVSVSTMYDVSMGMEVDG